MPRYFFNVRDGKDIFDTEGTELIGQKAIRIHAVATAAELLSSEIDHDMWDGADWQMEVLDTEGVIVCSMVFSGTTRVI